MSFVIDPETLYVDDLPTIWSPVQWDLTPEQRVKEVEDQARASLLAAASTPEAILRLLLNETDIDRAFEPPDGYDPEQQGEWDETLITFQFKRPIRLASVERKPDSIYIEYDFGDLGYWALEIGQEMVKVERI